MKMTAKRITGFAAKFLIATIVLAFLALHSINFFMFVFPEDQAYYAWLGFGLTGGGFVAYIVIFLWEADTVLKKWTALSIAAVSGIGEILTAIFGMQTEAWGKAGFALTESDFNFMITAVGILALAHALALLAYMAGDKIIILFGDEDGDGIPNYRDADWKPRRAFAQDTQQVKQTDNKQDPTQARPKQ